MAWQFVTTFTDGNRLTLPPSHPIFAADVVRLVVLHGNQQTLDFIGGVDFVVQPPNEVIWTDLPVRAGDTIVVFNYGAGRLPVLDEDNDCQPCENNLMQRGLHWLTHMKERHESCRVIYQRANEFVELRATIGKTLLEQNDGHGGLLRFESRDFLFPTKRLRIQNVLIEPERCDHVREINGRVYEVLSLGDEPPFRYCDPFREMLRVHTKLVVG